MDLIGDEKSIRALFSELRYADEQITPGFTAVWQRARTRSLKPGRAFNLSYVAATALLVCALATLAIWTRYSQPARPAAAYAVLPSPANFPAVLKNNPDVVVPVGTVKQTKSLRVKSAPSRQMILANNRKTLTNSKTIDDWQSPTLSLLSSPSDDLFRSLPQLNENANEMKSFLPTHANEKEK
jgi:hypothetical protein